MRSHNLHQTTEDDFADFLRQPILDPDADREPTDEERAQAEEHAVNAAAAGAFFRSADRVTVNPFTGDQH